jgi:arabinan endo-1,5-alpha-L-arabinosidase
VGVLDQFFIRVGPKGNRTNYLFWGSFQGIFGNKLGPDMKTIISPAFQICGHAFEGSSIFEHEGKFYYIASSGTCCDGAGSTYHLTVGRSDHIEGPYISKEGRNLMDGEGTLLLRGDGAIGWVGPGHNGEIIKDDNGRYFIIYHAISLLNDRHPQPWGFTRRPLLMDEIIWDKDGWPTIENGLPSLTSKRAPYFKN